MRAWRRLALVQPPITPLPLPVRQLPCNFQREGRDVGVADRVVGAVLRDAAREAPAVARTRRAVAFDRHEVHEVEHVAEVHGEALPCADRRTRGPARRSPGC